jgi:hypothetical protein
MSEEKYCSYCGSKTDGQDFCGEFCQLQHEAVSEELTVQEIEYIVKACRVLPVNEKDDKIIDSLTPKLLKSMRLAKLRELFPGIGR